MPITIYEIKHNDIIWVSKDMIDKYSEIIVGEYYCVNDDSKLELYEKQVICNNQLFMLEYPTFVDNTDRKWYQFWKPSKIIQGYAFQCIDLNECRED